MHLIHSLVYNSQLFFAITRLNKDVLLDCTDEMSNWAEGWELGDL